MKTLTVFLSLWSFLALIGIYRLQSFFLVTPRSTDIQVHSVRSLDLHRTGLHTLACLKYLCFIYKANVICIRCTIMFGIRVTKGRYIFTTHSYLLFHGFPIHSQLNLWMQKLQLCREVQTCIYANDSGHAAENPSVLPSSSSFSRPTTIPTMASQFTCSGLFLHL